MFITDINREYTRRFRGPYFDMLLHDIKEDTWALVPAGKSMASVIIVGTRDQIMTIYDQSNAAGTAILQI